MDTDDATLDATTGEVNNVDTSNYNMDGVDEIKSTSDIPAVPFPRFVFTIAVIKDLLDLFTGGLAATIFSSLYYPVFGYWLKGQNNGKIPFIRNNIEKVLLKYIWMPLLDFIPFIGNLPLTSAYVYFIYREEKLLSTTLGHIVGKKLKP